MKVTALVIVGVIVALIIYDLLAYAFVGNDATISRVCLGICEEYRWFAICFSFCLGTLIGHLFLPQHQ